MSRPKKFVPEIVLHKAMDLFWTRGYAATSMDDLVHAMGISRASLYATFGDKKALFLSALSAYHESQLIPKLKKMIASGDILQSLITMVEKRDDPNEPCMEGDISTVGCFLTNCVTEISTSDPEIHRKSQEMLESMRLLFVEGLKLEIAHGVWPPETQAESMAGLIMIILMGLKVLHRSGANLSFAAASLQRLRS